MVKPRGTGSDAWEFTSKIYGKKEAQCRICRKKYTTSGNTSNVWKHLKMHGITSANSKNAIIGEDGEVQFRAQETESQESDNTLDNTDHSDHVDPVDGDDEEITLMDDSPSTSRSRASSRNSTSSFSRPPSSNSGSSIQPTINAMYTRINSFHDGGSRDAEITDALLFMICKSNLPLSFTESEGYHHFCQKTIPLWKPPSRATITRKMEKKYDALAERIKAKIAALPSVSLTMDGWTEPHNTHSFLGVTVHFADNDEIGSAVLGVEPLTNSHTSENLRQEILSFCNKWQIDPPKVSHAVTDNAPNIVKAAIDAFGPSKHLGCFNHKLNLVASSAVGYKSMDGKKVANVPGVPELVKKVKDIVTFSHNSTNFANELRRIQFSRGATEGLLLRLPQDVCVRWNSTYSMCTRFIDMREVVSLTLLKFPEIEMLTAAELATLQVVQNLLGPFFDATEEMSAEKTTTASTVIPIVAMINEELNHVEIPERDHVAQSLKKFLLVEMDRRFKDAEFNMLLAMATLLDPRYLKYHFKRPLAVSKAMTLIENEIVKDLRKENSKTARTLAPLPAQNPNPTPNSNKRRPLWDSHDKIVSEDAPVYSSDEYSSVARQEMKAFFSRKLTPRSSNPLALWNKDLQFTYPHLYKLAGIYVPAIATSTPSERLFSLAGRIISDERSRLTNKHLSQRIFLTSCNAKEWNNVFV